MGAICKGKGKIFDMNKQTYKKGLATYLSLGRRFKGRRFVVSKATGLLTKFKKLLHEPLIRINHKFIFLVIFHV